MKIAIGQIAHETNTFSNVPTTRKSFEQWEWVGDHEVISTHRGVEDYLGGMVERAEEKGIDLVPTFSAFANPSGVITADTYAELKRELLSRLDLHRDVDAVCLALHGAAVADGVDDVEGDILAEIRRLLGPGMPIVVTLDLHGNLTQRMVDYADVLLGVNFYPHTDSYDRGKEAVDIAERLVLGEIHPTMVLERLPLLLPTSTTNLSPAKDINELCWQWEAYPNVLDCTFFHGFAHTDAPVVCASVIAITDENETLARQAAQSVADMIWQRKESFFPAPTSPAEGIRRALSAHGKPIVLNETSDNPGGGTPGDGTYLLQAMLEAGLGPESCFGALYDPEVAEIAHEAGPGSQIHVRLGGKTDILHGDPIEVSAYVKSVSDGRFIQSSPMWRGKRMDLGKSARLIVDGLDIVVVSVSSQVFDDQVFLLHGIDVRSRQIVGLKSSQHFRAWYQPVAAQIITVDSPGLSSRQLDTFPYRRLARPVYPLDSVDR